MPNAGRRAMVEIGIIGGGASGALTAVNLLQYWRSLPGATPLTVTVIEGETRLGRGIAYSTTCSEHLLNVCAKGMSAYSDRNDHFYRWLQQVRPDAQPETFALRSDYGDYLQQLLAAVALNPSASARLASVQSKAQSIARSDKGVRITLTNGEFKDCDAVVVAVGNFPPQFGNFADRRWFHNNPWNARLSQEIQPADDVLLIGTGLTMIDVALLLRSQGHRGRLHAVSRHGYLPQPHRSYEDLAQEETTHFLPEPLPANARAAFRAVRAAVAQAEKIRAGGWRDVMNELRLVGQSLWLELDSAEKRRFLRHLRQLWEIHRHRMAPEIASALEKMTASDALDVSAARIVEMKHEQGRVHVELQPRGQQQSTRTIVVDHVVNCTGPDTDYRRTTDPLMRSLLDSGLAQPDQLGLGLQVSPNGAIIDADGKVQDDLFAVGALRKGTLWESTAIPELRDQAKQVCDLLIDQFGAGASSKSSITAPSPIRL